MRPEQMLQALNEWHDSYLLTGTAAAKLLGLLFVAVTLNAEVILSGARPHLAALSLLRLVVSPTGLGENHLHVADVALQE